MRFERLEILRFGKFTDMRLEFPSRGIDFHLVVGPNEAGKSTIRAAITDALFGIEPRTRFDFIHAYGELRLAAAVQSGELKREFHRLKRARAPLRDAGDQPLRDDLLQPFLGDMDRLSYERMFCLDHQRLVQGGDEILTARDDLARLLFETSSGITGFGRLRDALEEEAKQLWDRRPSRERAFNKAHEELRAAEKLLSQESVNARTWVEIERRAQDDREAFEAARRAHEAHEMRRTRLERIRRVAPTLQRLQADRIALDSLGPVAHLPPTARADLDRAERELAASDVLLERCAAGLDEARHAAGGIQVDRACLDRAADIELLGELRAQTRRFGIDIENRQAEARVKLDDAREIARRLAWHGDEAALEAMLPPAPVRAAIHELLQEHGSLAEAAANAARDAAERQRELDAVAGKLTPLAAAAPPSPRLRAALAAAQGLGAIDRRIAEAGERCAAARERLERMLQELRPWAGTVEALRALEAPLEIEARDHEARQQDLAARRQAQRDALHVVSTELAAQRGRIEHLRASKRPVTREALEGARRGRDALWDRIASGEIAPERSGFEAELEKADSLADLRFAGANDVALLEHALEGEASLLVREKQQREALAAVAGELEEHVAAWQARLRAIGLQPLPASRFVHWSERRRECLALADRLAEDELHHRSLLDARSLAHAELAASLAAGSPDLGPARPDAFQALVAHALETLRRMEAAESQRALLAAQQETLAAALGAAHSRTERAAAELARWHQRWDSHLAAARLPADTTRLAAAQALEQLASLATLLREIREIRRDRIEAMQRELDAFAALAGRLAAALDPRLESQSPDSSALALLARLADARRDAERFAAASAEVARCGAELDHARARRDEIEARLRPLMSASGATSLAQLREAVEKSERARALEAAIEAARSSCLESGDGLSLEQLEAEVAAEDPLTIGPQLNEAERERATLAERRDELSAAAARGDAELQRFDGRADAAAAEAQRQEALATMGAATERFVKVHIAARLLRWAIDRYREDRQGPLLKRAGEIFAILTRGSFDRLVADFEERTPRLKGRRGGGQLVDVEGMSEGTRDQLYLALRLAALEQQLDHGRALPFVADDLFINFDDERSAAGFEALAELATQTQVIFLTHHTHLLPIVERTIGRPVNVVRL